MNFLKKVYQTSIFDFLLLVMLLLFYAFLHRMQISVTPFHLFAMYSGKVEQSVKNGTSYKVFFDDVPVDISKFNSRKEQYLIRVLKVYSSYHKNNGEVKQNVYSAFHRRLPFLENQDLEKELYSHPDYKEEMKLWLEKYFDCDDCNPKIFEYSISLDKNLNVHVLDSIQIL